MWHFLIFMVWICYGMAFSVIWLLRCLRICTFLICLSIGVNVPLWSMCMYEKESCLVAIWRKGNGNTGTLSSPFWVINPRGVSPIFRNIGLVVIVTNLNTGLQFFIKNHKMRWREKELSSSYSLFSAWSVTLNLPMSMLLCHSFISKTQVNAGNSVTHSSSFAA